MLCFVVINSVFCLFVCFVVVVFLIFSKCWNLVSER